MEFNIKILVLIFYFIIIPSTTMSASDIIVWPWINIFNGFSKRKFEDSKLVELWIIIFSKWNRCFLKNKNIAMNWNKIFDFKSILKLYMYVYFKPSIEIECYIINGIERFTRYCMEGYWNQIRFINSNQIDDFALIIKFYIYYHI